MNTTVSGLPRWPTRSRNADPLIGEARERQRRRRVRLATVGLLAVLAASAVAAAYWGGGSSAAAQAQNRLAAALSNSNGLIVHMRTVTSKDDAPTDEWVDLATGRARNVVTAKPLGRIVTGTWYGADRTPGKVTIHQATLWFQSHGVVTQTSPFQTLPATGELCGCDPFKARPHAPAFDLRPKVTIEAAQVIHGQPTVHLRTLRGTPDNRETVDVWLSQTSYLPIRIVRRTNNVVTTTIYSWLPRTQANLAQVKLNVPHNFRPVR